MDLDADFSK